MQSTTRYSEMETENSASENSGRMTFKESYEKIVDNIEKVMKGQSRSIRMLLAGFISGGEQQMTVIGRALMACLTESSPTWM
jgi:ABC-type branched-subunit amino acid transport system ATPase component